MRKTGAFVPLYHRDDIYGFMRSVQNGEDEFGQIRKMV